MKKYMWHDIPKFIFSLCTILGGMFAITLITPGVSLGQLSEVDSAFPYQIQGEDYVPVTDATTEIATDIIKPDTHEETSILKRLTDFFRLSGTSYDTWTSKALNYVKRILNILLWLVSFLSLVMIIFAFYLIFFSKGEEAVTKARKILIGVGIALAIMGLARFITSYFFDIYTTVT